MHSSKLSLLAPFAALLDELFFAAEPAPAPRRLKKELGVSLGFVFKSM